MKSAVIFDCEFLCLEGSQRRFWCAAIDPDPVIAQIGATRISLEGDFAILDTFKRYVVPVDRHGRRYTLDAFFTQLTGVTEADIDRDGVLTADELAWKANGTRAYSA